MDEKRRYGAERERTYSLYNMQLYNKVRFTPDKWQMPIINNDNYIPDDLIGFNYALTTKSTGLGAHFFLDDYQFERVWRSPERYIDLFLRLGCMFTPDFSLYLDMKAPQQIFNVYRSRLLGAFYQAHGVKVIPTISWSGVESFEYCFKGIPQGSIVAVSTVGIMRNKYALFLFERGIKEMIKQIAPKTIILYGKKPDIDFQGIEVITFDNKNSGW